MHHRAGRDRSAVVEYLVNGSHWPAIVYHDLHMTARVSGVADFRGCIGRAEDAHSHVSQPIRNRWIRIGMDEPAQPLVEPDFSRRTHREKYPVHRRGSDRI